MKHEFSKPRRLVLQRSALGLVALAAGLPWGRTRATEHLPRVSEDDSTARQLKYVHDASEAGAARDGDAYCYNCRFFKGDRDTPWAGCDLFPGKLVNGQGWCNAWAAKS